MDRIEDEELRHHFSYRPCDVCGKHPDPFNDGHHIKSRGSGGHDIPVNLVTLCRRHHQEIHQYGVNKFLEVYPKFLPIISEKGWYRELIGTGRNGIWKWFNDAVLS